MGGFGIDLCITGAREKKDSELRHYPVFNYGLSHLPSVLDLHSYENTFYCYNYYFLWGVCTFFRLPPSDSSDESVSEKAFKVARLDFFGGIPPKFEH